MEKGASVRAIRRDYHAAWSAYLWGDYDACMDITRVLDEERSAFLEARALLRLGRPEEAVKILRFEAQDECERRRLMSTALARCGLFELAAQELQSARELATTPAEHAQIDFFAALQEWMLGNYDEAEQRLPAAGADAHLAASVYDLRGWICIARRDFRSALGHFMSAIQKESSLRENSDRYMIARVAYSALAIAREFSASPVVGEIEAAIDGITWTPPMQVAHFHILRHLAWSVAIEGNYSATFRYIRMARDIAPSPAWGVSIFCDMAYLALSIGERRWSETATDEARDRAAKVDWSQTQDEERKGLLLLAQLEANRDPHAAQQYLEVYDSLPPLPPMIFYNVRDVAFEAFVRGCVAHSMGDSVAAAAQYAYAFDLYESIGFTWRAILCAVARGEVTHKREHFEYAAMQLRTFPNSWLRARVADVLSVHENPISERFTPTQLEVLQGLCQGMTDRAIGEWMGRSMTTVRDHLKEIRRITRTKNRSELVAYCARNGLIIKPQS